MLEWLPKIDQYLSDFDNLIDNIFLLGGSFNHQTDVGIEYFLTKLWEINKPYKKKIWIFAREELKDVKPIFKEYCQFIKTGAYIPELKCEDNIQYSIKLATKNQNVYEQGLDF